MGLYEKVLGTLLIGIFFNTYLYGVVTFQFATYYNTKFNDPLWIKGTVLILFIVDTFHTAASIYMAWDYTVTNYTNPSILAVALWPYTFTPIGTGIAAIFTQVFLGYRIYRLTGNRYLYAGILVVAVAAFAFGVACGTRAWILKDVAKFAVLKPIVTAWLSLQVGLDVIISGILTFVLSQSRTGFRSTDTVVNRLIRGAIQTGIFASIFSLGDLISFIGSPSTNLYGTFAIPIGRIYTNTLMDTLLMREGLKEILAGTVDMDTMTHADTIWGKSTVTKRDVYTDATTVSGSDSKFRPTQTDFTADNKSVQ